MRWIVRIENPTKEQRHFVNGRSLDGAYHVIKSLYRAVLTDERMELYFDDRLEDEDNFFQYIISNMTLSPLNSESCLFAWISPKKD